MSTEATITPMSRHVVPVLVPVTLLAVLIGPGVAGELKARHPLDPSNIRGANYTPSYASTSIATWKEYDGKVIDRELGFARRLSLNSVRVFLQYVVYREDPDVFLGRLENFVGIAARHGIRPMFVLFDSCFGDEPTIDKVDSPTWVNNPGFSRIGEENWPELERYAGDVVRRFKGDGRVLAWDIMNEPMADFGHVTREERDAIWRFCRHFCRFVKQADPEHPITVGHAVVEYIPRTIDIVDLLSVHSYARYPKWLEGDLDLALFYGKEAGKPVIVTEFGNPGAGQDYEMALDVIERKKLGFYFWELMIGKVMFREMAGLVYPDGTIRQPGPVARLLGFPLKSDGGVSLKAPPQESALKNLLEHPEGWKALLEDVRKAPRTRETVLATLPPLVTVGRFRARPGPEAMEIFELGLNVGQLYRMGREAEALAQYETLLDLVGKVIRRPSGAMDVLPR